MTMRNILIGLCTPMLSGFIIGINMVYLLGIQPEYEAAWWKVGLALVGGVFSWITTQWRVEE